MPNNASWYVPRCGPNITMDGVTTCADWNHSIIFLNLIKLPAEWKIDDTKWQVGAEYLCLFDT